MITMTSIPKFLHLTDRHAEDIAIAQMKAFKKFFDGCTTEEFFEALAKNTQKACSDDPRELILCGFQAGVHMGKIESDPVYLIAMNEAVNGLLKTE